MAQALFDDHPIEHYLRESGEVLELMPGGLEEFSREHLHSDVPYGLFVLMHWLPRLLNMTQLVLESTGLRRPSIASEFAERFKYVVISSSLLSSSLSSSSSNRAVTPTTPGHYDQSTPSHPVMTSTTTPVASSTTSHLLTFSLACLVPATMAQGYYLAGLLILAAVKFLADGGLDLPTSFKSNHGDESWATTLDNLDALVKANNAWDNVVSESLGVLEHEEQSAFHPSSPSSSLRIALSSSLHTTQTQCDNVRQLLAAVTSPLVLSQLSHMYSPPSPSRMSASPKRPRPMSLVAPSLSPVFPRPNPYARPPSLSTPPSDAYTRSRVAAATQTSLVDKRSTWNGSYMSLAGGPSPRRSRRRSNLSATFRLEDLKSHKSPKFPESDNSMVSQMPIAIPTVMEDLGGDADAEDEPFGVAALDMHRKRRSMRGLMFDTPSPPSSATIFPSLFPSSSRFPDSRGSPLTSSFGSRFTSFSSTSSGSRQAHPLSLSNVHLALQGALGSKRFACAHLLALRFPDSNVSSQAISDVGSDTDSEDESYWEDVRSVISLLTSTLEDASARLAEALADTVRMQEQETLTDDESYAESACPERGESRRSSTVVPSSFAPMPSHLTRFAAHVDAITSALDDAREHLQQCVAALQEDEGAPQVTEDLESPVVALQSYERLRRELGLALRECERGRGTLLELIHPSTPDRLAEEEGDEESPVRHEEQLSSGESDKTLFNVDEVHELKHSSLEQEQDPDQALHEDDATSHLILTASSQHLPPPGIEQVFESVSAVQPFVRERSKLTREERIRLAKARRESQFGALDSVPDAHEGEPWPARESWGPGGEVVQELKDVIWKVGEQRRKMVERSSSLEITHSDTPHPPP